MSDSNVIKFAQPGAFTDSLTEILRSGARALLTQAVEAEVAEFLAKHTDLKTETGQQRVVRHGHLPEREIMTGIGPVQAFGEAGSYLRIKGIAKGEIDPAALENSVITDLDKAPRNAHGMVEYETDFFILRPSKAASSAQRPRL